MHEQGPTLNLQFYYHHSWPKVPLIILINVVDWLFGRYWQRDSTDLGMGQD